MRLLLYYALCYLSFINGIFASVRAGPYEILFYYYAYRMEINTVGPDHAYTATGCFGSLPDKSCKLDEFIEHIQAKPEEWSEGNSPTGIGDNLTPDIHDAADKIRNSGFNCRVDGNALLPRVYTDGPQNEVDLANVFRRIVNNMQYTRQTFGDDRVATELRRAQLAIASVIDMRNADQAENLLADLNRPTAKGGLGWIVASKEIRSSVTGLTWNDVDIQRTLDEHFADSAELVRKTFKNFVTQYRMITTSGPGGGPAGHERIIQALKPQIARLEGRPSC